MKDGQQLFPTQVNSVEDDGVIVHKIKVLPRTKLFPLVEFKGQINCALDVSDTLWHPATRTAN